MDNPDFLTTARAAWKRIILAMALLVLLPSWLGLLGSWHWFLDLMAHFRWQYLGLSTLVVGWAIWRRRRMVLVLATSTLLLNGVLIARLAWHPGVDDRVASDFSLRVISFNLLTSNPEKQRVLDYLLAADADVVCLLELDSKWLAALAPLEAKYPYRIADARPDNFGIAVYSRIPWQQAAVLDLGDPGLPSIEVALRRQGRELTIIATHPMPPAGRRNAAWRDGQLARLASHVSLLQKPALVVGDLNATPWSAGLRLVTAGGLGFRSLQPPWMPTWRARSVFAIPIDHALGTAPLVITRREIGPDLGSDHRPLLVSVGWGR
jgi:endonuclease/exonuclease/phosphatase (EEP) superfamily protein YafD